MPRINVPVTTITRDGVAKATATTGDATNNHSVANNGHTVLEVENTGVTSRILTVHVDRSVDGQAVASRTYSIGAGAIRQIGPFDIPTYSTLLLVDVAHAELKLLAYRF